MDNKNIISNKFISKAYPIKISLIIETDTGDNEGFEFELLVDKLSHSKKTHWDFVSSSIKLMSDLTDADSLISYNKTFYDELIHIDSKTRYGSSLVTALNIPANALYLVAAIQDDVERYSELIKKNFPQQVDSVKKDGME